MIICYYIGKLSYFCKNKAEILNSSCLSYKNRALQSFTGDGASSRRKIWIRQGPDMRITVSVCNFKEYENDERGATFEADISEETFDKLLETLHSYLEDHPHYHCQLRNDLNEPVYLVLDIFEHNC